MDIESFSELVSEALEALPFEFRDRLENVQIDIEEWPSAEELVDAGLGAGDREYLLGLYHGVPLTERTSFYVALPDRITIYMRPVILVAGPDAQDIAEQVRHTVIHEIAHYYGIDDDRLEELGAY